MRFDVMDYNGHSTIEFDKTDPVALKEAMEKFEELVKTHTAAHRDEGQRDYHVSRNFEPHDETLFVPVLKGG